MDRLRRPLALLAIAAAMLVVLGPIAGAWIVRSQVLPRFGRKIGRTVRVGDVWVRWGRLEMRDFEIDGAGAISPVRVPRMRVRFDVWPLLVGKISLPEVLLDQPRIVLVRGEPGDDNVSSILEHLQPRFKGTGKSHEGKLHIGKIKIAGGAMAVADASMGQAVISRLDADLQLDGPGQAELGGVTVDLFAGPRASADRVDLKLSLLHGRLDGVPIIEVAKATASPIKGFDLTGIKASLTPDAADPSRFDLDVRGSYFGGERELWNVRGWVSPTAREGELKMRADRMKLGKLKGLVETEHLMDVKNAEVDAHFDVSYKDDLIKFGGAFHLAGLTVANPKLAPVAVPHVGFDARTKGSVDLAAHKLHLDEAVVNYNHLHAALAAEVENLGKKPKFAATLTVRPVPCQQALSSLPPELVPNLQGFQLTGTFSTDLHLGLDLEDLDAPIDLGGKVGIEGCKVVQAPAWVDAEKRLSSTFLQTVQYEPGKWMTFFVGPENPDWTPYDQISPNLINSIMTTEDNGFFKHHGFIPSEFRSALQQNLQRGYFRLGASSITMQMVKNVLLSREKTLSRKLQEMFLTWYVEHHLTKERILEIYFNVIEFGPGIYGIGRAARHYFGEPPMALQPQQAAWFSSILPNPKKRYIQYCHKDGALDAKWDAYVKRIMKKNHERGRLTDEEFAQAMATPFRFDRAEAMPEKECIALVKRVTTPPGPPVEQARN